MGSGFQMKNSLKSVDPLESYEATDRQTLKQRFQTYNTRLLR